MIERITLLTACVTVVASAGCALPGQHFESENFELVESEAPVEYDLFRISPSLLMSLEPVRRGEPHENTELAEAIRDYRYRVGPQDILSFTVWDHPELTIPAGQFREPELQGHIVDPEGLIFYPYIGEVAVAGRTLSEIRTEVSERLGQFVQNPQLDVRVAAFRSKRVHVTGDVQQPGVLPITNVPLTLMEALTLSGGPASTAALQQVRVIRNGSARRFDVQALLERGDIRENVLLADGDIVYVPESSFYSVHVMGEIREPGTVPMPRGRLNLAEAINLTGGFDLTTADPEYVLVFRGDHDTPGVFWLNASSPDAMLLATQFDLQPQDVVYVASSGIARWNRVISLILPSVQTLWQTQTLIDQLQD